MYLNVFLDYIHYVICSYSIKASSLDEFVGRDLHKTL